jgi:hypothetical protein
VIETQTDQHRGEQGGRGGGQPSRRSRT